MPTGVASIAIAMAGMHLPLAISISAQAISAFVNPPPRAASTGDAARVGRSPAAAIAPSPWPLASLPGLNYGLSDEEFRAWLAEEFDDCPGRDAYSSVYEDAADAVVRWRRRYRGDPLLWKRVFKKERVAKELVESAPIIESVRRVVDSEGGTERFTIMDLCSGKGYLSMFLSEMLPRDKVERFVLVDKAWAIASNETKELKPHHMNWDHIYGMNPLTKESYFTTWPIPLFTSKQDLKQSCNQRQMKKHIFRKTNGPIIVLAVHLCGVLSIRAVEMFNDNENVKLFALKPCCLPNMAYAKRGDVFRIGGHEFDAKDVCSNGSFNRKTWDGPPRWHLQPKFDLWADNLFRGVDVGPEDRDSNDSVSAVHRRRVIIASNKGLKARDEIRIQVDGGFQNKFIFAERYPLTPSIWNME